MTPGRARLVLLLFGVLACAAYTAAELRALGEGPGFPLDDGWIHLQFARNLAAGRGLAYTPGGEPVAGSTAPLWSALLALAFLLPGNPVGWVKVLGAVAYLGGGLAASALAAELGAGRGLARLAGWLTLATGWLVWGALSGLEIPLFVLLTLVGMRLHARERRRPGRAPLALPVLALATLARPEGALLLALAVADRVLRFERHPAGGLALRLRADRALAAGLLGAAVVLLPVALFHLAVSGSVLPTTFAAKASGVHRWLPEGRYLYAVLGILFRPQPVALLLAGAGALTLVERLGGRRDAGLLPALWLAALPLAYGLINPPGGALLAGNFGRYFFPLLPVVAVLGVLGTGRAVESVGPWLRLGRRRLAWRPAAAVLVLLPTIVHLAQGSGRYVQNVANVRDSDVAMARWLAPRLAPEAVLAVNDIGALQYLLPNRLLDLAGIVDPQVPRYIRAARAAGAPWQDGVRRFLEERRPDYLVIFPEWFPELTGPGTGFRPIYGLRIPRNVTMGADELVLFATPWTRHPLARVEAEAGPGAGPAADPEAGMGAGPEADPEAAPGSDGGSTAGAGGPGGEVPRPPLPR